MVRSPIFPTDNRISGILRELQDALHEEDSAITLAKAERTIRLMAYEARSLAHQADERTKQLTRAVNAQPARRTKWRLP